MSETNPKLSADRDAIREARAKGVAATVKTYSRLSGPGWLQGAITLGGGSLSGALYLGVLSGFALLWLQPIAMILGIVMLSAISFVTLSTGKRPFQAIKQHINPVLGWGWAIATLMANIVWCMPQFTLGTAAIQQNLIPALGGDAIGTKMAIGAALFLIASAIIWSYDSGGKGVQMFEVILKIMVGVVVISFFGVVISLAMSENGLPFGQVFQGFIPDLSLLSKPAATFDAALAATGDYADYWRERIVGMQRDVMVTATATAVGINMTFLLPYSMLKKGWDREFRGLAIFDLSIGLFVPFLLATSCVVIAAASQFHVTEQPGLVEGTSESAGLVKQYNGELAKRVETEVGPEAFAALGADAISAQAQALPEGDRRIAAMLVKRDAFVLANALEPFAGATVSQYVFGIGVLGMALSTIIILMLINGFTVCEMLDKPASGNLHRIGCMIPAIVGFFAPILWKGNVQTWLAVPTSVFGMALLPIAYLSFYLLVNHKKLLGEDALQGGKKIAFNAAMSLALALSAFGAGWSIWSKTKWWGVGLVGVLAVAAYIFRVRPPAESPKDPQV